MLGIVPVITLIISPPAGHTCKLAQGGREDLGRSYKLNYEHCFGVSVYI